MSDLRVIAGRWRGRRLKAASGSRPTSQRVREAIFSMIQGEVPGAVVLDCFCGSGALGIEALSRGATSGYFVDNRNVSVLTARENLRLVGAPPARVRRLEVGRRPLPGDWPQSYDLVFADPPYDDSLDLLELACQLTTWCAPGGSVVLEHAARHPQARGLAEAEVWFDPASRHGRVVQRDYGDTRVSWARFQDGCSEPLR